MKLIFCIVAFSINSCALMGPALDEELRHKRNGKKIGDTYLPRGTIVYKTNINGLYRVPLIEDAEIKNFKFKKGEELFFEKSHFIGVRSGTRVECFKQNQFYKVRSISQCR